MGFAELRPVSTLLVLADRQSRDDWGSTANSRFSDQTELRTVPAAPALLIALLRLPA
jgi:hypothetical protein